MPIISEDGKIPHITTHWILMFAECCYFPNDSLVFSHFMYMVKFVGCETLNLVNVLGQMYFMDIVLNNQFLRLGSHIQNWEQLNIALNTLFPLGK